MERLGEQFEPGSIVDVPGHDLTTRFVLAKRAKRIQVVATSPSTWLLRAPSELVVRGRLVPAGELGLAADPPYVLVVSGLNGKCASKYDGNARFQFPPSPSDPLTYR
jgi:hypothetical protein